MCELKTQHIVKNLYPIFFLTLTFLVSIPPLKANPEKQGPEVLVVLDQTSLYENNADTVLSFVQELGRKYGATIHLGGTEKKLDWSVYRMIVFIGEKSLLQLTPTAQAQLKTYMLGIESADEKAILGIFFQEDRNTSSLAWPWYQKLKEEMMQDRAKSESIPLRFSALMQETLQSSQPMAYQRIFPSLLPEKGKLGGNHMFFSYMAGMSRAFSHKKTGLLQNNLLQRHLENAWAWSLGEGEKQVDNTEILSLSLKANGNQVLFNWRDLLEEDNSEYLLQKSEDALTWHVIHARSAHKEPKEIGEYTYLDQNISAGDHMFRILKREQGKEDLYSIPVILSVSESSPQVELFPNPVRDMLFVNISGAPSSETQISIQGVLLSAPAWEKTISGEFLSYKLPVSVSTLSPGLYHVCVKTEKNQVWKSFVKYE